jgi:serine/threonine protein kinase/Tol biopolymer transport system component
MTLQAGTRLGPYEIAASIGAGGMGEVWRARDTRLDREVAVKVLPPGFARDEQLLQRFEREAKAISQLSHPNICTLYDVGEETVRTKDAGGKEESLRYLVMELLEGDSLADRLKKGPLPLHDVLKYGRQVASALEAAHRRGITHRDLKPGNVMLTRSGAKLLDFGLAKNATEGRAPVDGLTHLPTEAKPLTEQGTILGTFQYMAPEQLEGLEADARTDIFALGAVLYEMATGHRAFQGGSKTSLIASIVSSQPEPISRVTATAPPALDHVVRRCLEKDPDDRWQSAQDVASELQWISEAGSQAGVPGQILRHRKTRERLLWISGLLVTAALAGILGWRVPRAAEAPSYSFEIPSRTERYQGASQAQVSPDGARVAFGAWDADHRKWRLWIRRLDSIEAHPIEGAEDAGAFFWSPDSSSIAFYRHGQLLKVPVSGGPAQPIAQIKFLRDGAWSRSGTILVATGAAALTRIDPGGQPRIVTRLDPSVHEFVHFHPVFLPDGRRFLFTGNTRDPDKPEQSLRLYLGSLDSDEVRYLGEVGSRVEYVEPGYLLAVRDATLLAYPFDPDDPSVASDPRTIMSDIWYFKPNGFAHFSSSRNGVLVAQGPPSPGQLEIVSREGIRRGTVGSRALVDRFRISPDGSTLAAARQDPRVGTYDIWLLGLGRETQRRFTFESTWEGDPVWSPDGRRIFYSSDKAGPPDIYARAVDRSEDERIVAETGPQYPRDVSPDGRLLLYQTFDDPTTHGDLYVLPLDGSAKRKVFLKTPFSEGSEARFSPDGRFVLYTSDETGQQQVYVRPFPGPGPAREISIDGGRAPRWSPDGRHVYFVHDRKLMTEAFSPRGGTASEPVVQFTFDSEIGAIEVLPSGDGFVAEALHENSRAPLRVYVNWTRLLE